MLLDVENRLVCSALVTSSVAVYFVARAVAALGMDIVLGNRRGRFRSSVYVGRCSSVVSAHFTDRAYPGCKFSSALGNACLPVGPLAVEEQPIYPAALTA